MLALARRVRRARAIYLNEFWTPKYLASTLTRTRLLADERRKEGWPSNGLSAHQNRVALLSALATLKSAWLATSERTEGKVTTAADLSALERRWLRYVLRTPHLLQLCLEGEVVLVEKPWAMHADACRLSRRLRRTFLRCRGATPHSRSLAFDVDTNLYDVRAITEDRHFAGAWLRLTIKGDGTRLRIPLAGRDIEQFAPRTDRANSRPGLRIDFAGARIRFRSFERVSMPTRTVAGTAGLDVGYRTLLTVSRGDASEAHAYGTDDAQLIRGVVERHEARRRRRSRLMAYERSVRNTSPSKARRIRRSNLGSKKQRRASQVEKSQLHQLIGRALNEMFRNLGDVAVLHIEHLDFRGTKRPRRTTRLLRRWQFDYLHRHLTLKAQLHGVRLNVVNAAWTSLTCPICGYLSRANRRSESFECGSCGYTGSADAIAATNILRRGSDGAITRFTSRDDAERILQERWRSARSGRAWDSAGVIDRIASASRELDEVSSSSTAPVPLVGRDQPSPQ